MTNEIMLIGKTCDFGARGGIYDTDGISPSLCAGMSHGNTMPFIIVKDKTEDERDSNTKQFTDALLHEQH